MNSKSVFTRQLNPYRFIVLIGFIAVVILVLIYPVKMFGASPWAYYFGVENFAAGKLVVDDATHTQQVNEAKELGGNLMQYMDIGDNKWALEKAPGYVFYLVPFQWLGIPRLGNILLAFGMVIVTYILLRRMRDEKTACIGSLLMLFTPVTLIMMNIVYFDTFASLAFLVVGGGLYIYYHLERGRLRPWPARCLLFFAFLSIAWSVVTRYTNFPVAAVIALHFAIMRFIDWRKGEKLHPTVDILPVALGIMLPAAVLLWYNYMVFGSPFDYGYQYSTMPVEFAFQYIGQVDKSGQSIPLTIIMDNIKSAPEALFWGFPILAIGVPAFGIILYQKIYFAFRKGSRTDKWYRFDAALSWDIFLLLIGWFISVFCLYLMYEFTAEYLGGDSSLIRFARFYLPGLFPAAVISALAIGRLPLKFSGLLLAAMVIICSVLYIQYMTQGQSSHGSRSSGGGTTTQTTTRQPPRR